MQYLTVEEMEKNEEAMALRMWRSRPLPLRGESVDFFQRFVPSWRARVLDCGAGAGGFVKALLDKGYTDVSACDVGDYLRPEIKKACAGFRAADLSFDVLPWKDGALDAVTAWEVLEHLENPYHAVREIHRVLNDGGLFIFSVPNIFNIVSRLVFLKRGLFPRWHAKNNHLSLFPRGIFEKMFLQYFDVVEEIYVRPWINLPVLRSIYFLPKNEWFGHWALYVLKKKQV